MTSDRAACYDDYIAGKSDSSPAFVRNVSCTAFIHSCSVRFSLSNELTGSECGCVVGLVDFLDRKRI